MAEYVTFDQAKRTVRLSASFPDDTAQLMETMDLAEATCLSYIGGVPEPLTERDESQLRAAILALTAYMWRFRGDDEEMPLESPDDLPGRVVMFLRRLRTPPVA